jgi:protein tyrosine/serine phosphatase
MLPRLLIAGLLAFSLVGAEAPPIVHVNNFAAVNDHLWRGAEPSAVGLAELGAAGVKVIIDLRETGAATQFEKQRAEILGMKYTNIPFPPLSAPSAAQVRMVLNLLEQNQSQTVFLHCRRGKDRTGTVIACYRIQHDGWDNERALSEAKHFGMSSAERGMRSFVLHFTPALAPSPLAPVTH